MKWDHGWVECSDALLKRAPPTDKGYYSCMLAQQLETKWTLNPKFHPAPPLSLKRSIPAPHIGSSTPRCKDRGSGMEWI